MANNKPIKDTDLYDALEQIKNDLDSLEDSVYEVNTRLKQLDPETADKFLRGLLGLKLCLFNLSTNVEKEDDD